LFLGDGFEQAGKTSEGEDRLRESGGRGHPTTRDGGRPKKGPMCAKRKGIVKKINAHLSPTRVGVDKERNAFLEKKKKRGSRLVGEKENPSTSRPGNVRKVSCLGGKKGPRVKGLYSRELLFDRKGERDKKAEIVITVKKGEEPREVQREKGRWRQGKTLVRRDSR